MAATRRSFIRYASLAAAGNIAGLRPFGMLNALAQNTSDYKALVCVYLSGGNDGNNMIVPLNDTVGVGGQLSNYNKYRGGVKLDATTMLPLGSAGDYGLHPSMPELQGLYNNQSAALLCNVGNLVEPFKNTADFMAKQGVAANVPANLYSHLDQELQWQNASQSVATQTGWGGRMADLMASNRSYSSLYNAGATIPMITSIAGGPLFANGAQTSPMSVIAGKAGQAAACNEDATTCNTRDGGVQTLLSLGSGVKVVQADMGIGLNMYKYQAALSEALQYSTPLSTVFPDTKNAPGYTFNPLSLQLQQVAQIMQVRSHLGLTRQIFFVELDGFDTHADQVSQQATLLSMVSQALKAFNDAVTNDLGIPNQVTTFTISDFSRCLLANTATGTDHAWGSHQIIMGGAVNGGQMYGTYPTLSPYGPDDNGQGIGRFIPSTAVVQSAATLAQWFGVAAGDLPQLFPNIGNFPTSDLGFMKKPKA